MNEIAVNEPKVIDSSFVAFANLHSAYIISIVMSKIIDEGMPNRLLIFAYLVFGPGGIAVEGITRPMRVLA
jgi:hypothetical protein